MVLSEKYENNRLLISECVFYDGEDEYGVTVRVGQEDKIVCFTECHFENGKKLSYLFALVGRDGGNNDTVTELSFETYQYENELFVAGEYDSFFPSMPLLNRRKYQFDRDQNGCLYTYRIEEYDGETMKSGFWDDIYLLFLNRKDEDERRRIFDKQCMILLISWNSILRTKFYKMNFESLLTRTNFRV